MSSLAQKLYTSLLLIALATTSLACSTTSSGASSDEALSEQEIQAESALKARQFQDSPIIPIGDSATLGDPNAPIVIVEFVSMQCPFCARSAATTGQLLEKYPDQVQLVFKHLPLYFQPQARDASRMLEAARQQDAFWQMQDAIFDRMADLQTLGALDLGLEIADELGLDPEQLLEDFTEPMIEKIIQDDMALAEKLGVQGTPNFFINGIGIQGAQPLPAFEEAVALAAAKLAKLREEGTPEEELYQASVKFFIEAQEEAAREAAADQIPDTPATAFVEVNDQDLVYGEEEDFLVTIVEFSSLQCPFCARASNTTRQLLEDYGDKVRFVFKHSPLPMHRHSIPAGQALIAAQQQGQGLSMLHHIYDNQKRLNEEGVFDEFARELDLDLDQFQTTFAADQTGAQIDADKAHGETLGVRGTPHFFINGTTLVGAQPMDRFTALIDEELQRAQTLQKEQGLSGDDLYRAIVDEK